MSPPPACACWNEHAEHAAHVARIALNVPRLLTCCLQPASVQHTVTLHRVRFLTWYLPAMSVRKRRKNYIQRVKNNIISLVSLPCLANAALASPHQVKNQHRQRRSGASRLAESLFRDRRSFAAPRAARRMRPTDAEVTCVSRVE